MKQEATANGMAEKLAALMARVEGGAPPAIANLARLSGGASQESWRFDADGTPLLFRRVAGRQEGGMTAQTEGELIAVLYKAGLPVPRVAAMLQPDDGLGEGFIMERYEGETIPRKLLRDDAYAAIRPKLAGQCGRILANIHACDTASLPALPVSGARAQIEHYQAVYTMLGGDDPLHLYAFHWLAAHCPPDVSPALVHGDYRNGNLMIGTDGVRRVLDWELTHLGDVAEDLSWFCMASWRFGVMDCVAGGFGSRNDLLDGYKAAGGNVPDEARQQFWDVMSALKWAVMCATIAAREQGSVEHKVIGRRVSESELNLLMLLAPDEAKAAVCAHLDSMPVPAPFPALPILQGAETFLRNTAKDLRDQQALHAIVAANGLAIAARDAEQGQARRNEEAARLKAITGENNAAAARQKLSHALESGEMAMSAELAHHLWLTTLARLAIDQPTYAPYRILCTENAKGEQI